MKLTIIFITVLIIFSNVKAQSNYIVLRNYNTGKTHKIKKGRKIIFSLEGQTDVLKGRLTKIKANKLIIQIKRKSLKKQMEIQINELTLIGYRTTCKLLYSCSIVLMGSLFSQYDSKLIFVNYKFFYLYEWKLNIVKSITQSTLRNEK